MKQRRVIQVLIVWLLLLCCSVQGGNAAQQPAMALFDGQHGRIMSLTEWRDIDFGGRSTISGRKQPASVFAIQAALTVTGGVNSPTVDTKGSDDLLLIPYCSPTADSATAGATDACSLRHYEGYVLLRFRGGWEGDFAASLWRDSTLGTNMRVAVHLFRALANESGINFPFQMDGSATAGTHSVGVVRRHELVENCGDFTDECFQGRYMTYTRSFKEMPLDTFTGRIMFHIGAEGAWNGPWTLRLQNSMPHDSSTDVDIVVVLLDNRESFRWKTWLLSSVMGNIVLMACCILWVVCFIVGTKELGMRLTESMPLNERRPTVLYTDDDSDNERCMMLHRIMLAVLESCVRLAASLAAAHRASWRCLRCPLRRRWAASRAHTSTTDETQDIGAVKSNAREVEMQNLVADDNEGGGDEDDDTEVFCRICRCEKPVEELFAPCSCDGSAKYVHRSCLAKWRAMTTNEEHRRACAECKTPYVLVLERVPVSPDEFLRSPICVPACRTFATRAAVILFFAFQLWFGGYYLKLCMWLATGLDDGVIWSAAHLYHWVLGFYYLVALSLNIYALEYVLRDFSESWQQLLILLISLGAVEVPLSYVGQILLSWLLSRTWSLEVSYGLGIITTAVLYVEMLPHLYEHLQSLSTVREVVAPRAEQTRNREV
ncbi:hypothetical protein DQ04_03281040 [Trypanosoma grayi]|uniref:hypothetical protein n=1 Tax=Trypanosoma grayi TaxID=71804 RepID=UPI0004F3F1FC|nr:hypothetical protein DQ04_03281040 [Trypanosoma grayi]KEG10801.1 hypothetical protein DQ04_03281040 [Trypanosoma grayi]